MLFSKYDILYNRHIQYLSVVIQIGWVNIHLCSAGG